MARCLLALGSNLGDRRTILEHSCAQVAALPGCQLLARSRWHVTPPIGGADGQGAFLNGALLVSTTLSPAELATALQEIETRLGRERVARWDARRIDIDMLLFAEAIIDTIDLVVPHPRMAFRSFVLEPATEIAGEMLHPSSGWTLCRLLAHLQTSPRYVVVAAPEGPIADWIVMHFGKTLGCPMGLSSSEHGVSCEKNGGSENSVGSGVSRLRGGVEFSGRLGGAPPVVVAMRPEELDSLRAAGERRTQVARPALVIALEMANLQGMRDAAQQAKRDTEANRDTAFVTLNNSKTALPDGLPPAVSPPAVSPPAVSPHSGLQSLGLGPMARITAEDPATVLQEALAAVRSVWPDILSQTSNP